MLHGQFGQVDFDELGQILGQNLDFDLGHDVVDDSLGLLDGRRVLTVDEVQRHFDGDLLVGSHALEVDVQDLLLVRVPLHVAQQHALFLAVDVHVQDGRVEGFDAQGVIESVVVEGDLDGSGFATVDDTGYLIGATEAAARTRPHVLAFLGTDLHWAVPWICLPVRDQIRQGLRKRKMITDVGADGPSRRASPIRCRPVADSVSAHGCRSR